MFRGKKMSPKGYDEIIFFDIKQSISWYLEQIAYFSQGSDIL